jgi:hypothetical protein
VSGKPPLWSNRIPYRNKRERNIRGIRINCYRETTIKIGACFPKIGIVKFHASPEGFGRVLRSLF